MAEIQKQQKCEGELAIHWREWQGKTISFLSDT